MYQRKESSKNTYYPSFLCLEVDTPDYLDALLRIPLDERTEAAFLHEYIHYLQDVTTIAGYARIETIVDQIKWAVGDKAKNRSKIRLPLEPNKTWAFNMKPNATNLQLCKGDFKIKDKNGKDITPDIVTPISFDLVDTQVNFANGIHVRGEAKAVFVFSDENSAEHKYAVGELAISESMAFLIENRIYPNVLAKGGDCPYQVVRKIVEYKLKKQLDDLVLIAICDVCLMYSLPGNVLYYILEELLKITTEITPALVYVIGLGSIIGNKFNRQGSWIEEIEKTNRLAKKQMADYFVHPYWNQMKTIVCKTFDDALNYRKDRPTLFLDIACGGRLYENKAFITTLGLLGCLSVKTSSDLVYNFLPRSCVDMVVDSDWFICLHQFYNLLFTNDAIKQDHDGALVVEKECELKKWCHDSFTKKGEHDLTTSGYNCKYSPWMNTSPEEMAQCSFGRLWGAFDLMRIKLKASTKKTKSVVQEDAFR